MNSTGTEEVLNHPIAYRVRASDPAAHLFEIVLTIAPPSETGHVLSMPSWIPGSYMIREFAKNVVTISAHTRSAHGVMRKIAVEKLDKQTWRIAPTATPLRVTYTVYAWDLSVRCAHLDETHGFLNGASVFLRVDQFEHQPHVVELVAPTGPNLAQWRVATTLPELAAPRHGFGTYIAENYDALIDHPIEMGTFKLARFEACGALHEVAITGTVPHLDLERITADLKRICELQIRFFEPKRAKAPFQRYVFLAMVVPAGYGGLEHRSSTALLCTRDQLPVTGKAEQTDGYRTFLGLASHEYFHSWNVKRIKPQVFAPYDLRTENHTRLLWIFEGFTSYYDDLLLLRAKLLTPERYFDGLTKSINSVQSGPGRLTQSLADSSFDAWTKYYRPDENTPNAVVSYYQKGSLVGLLLDLHLRRSTQNRRSLDDVMRLLWRSSAGIFIRRARLD